MSITEIPPATVDSPASEPAMSSAPTLRDRLLLAALLIGTAVLYLVNITANGNANAFYAGSAWAGSRNWEALLFGSVDPSNFITVDKPPLSQWVMGLSGQIFGYSSASMLIPEALMGVASVALIYAAATRISGRTAGLIAGTALALTPVAALMFRYNNPDASMVLLMTLAAYCVVRATPRASMKWLVLAGVALGFAFLAKMLEGLMILPALGLVYLIAAPTTLRNRIGHLLAATAALIVSAGWYVVLTMVWPTSSRPYLAGSTDNSFLNLVFGYNGLARIQGRDHSGHAQPTAAMFAELQKEYPQLRHFGGGGMFGAKPGITRLFTGEFGAEISFLLPSALIALVAVLIIRGRRPRTDIVRAGAILFGVWLVVDGLVLSFMNGTTHPYYSLAIAPPIAALIGIGAVETWRAGGFARIGLAGMILAGGIWSFVLLDHQPSWQPWLRWVVLVGAAVAAAAVVVTARMGRRAALIAAAAGIVMLIAAPAAYAINNDTIAHTGGGPSVLPDQSGSHGNFGGSAPTAELTALLQNSHARWPAAVDRTASASSLELATHVAVMGIGGFMDDPTPTLAEFRSYADTGQVRYYLVSDRSFGGHGFGGGQGGGHSRHSGGTQGGFGGFGNQHGVGAQIQQWVTTHYTGTKMGDYTVYDLSTPKA